MASSPVPRPPSAYWTVQLRETGRVVTLFSIEELRAARNANRVARVISVTPQPR